MHKKLFVNYYPSYTNHYCSFTSKILIIKNVTLHTGAGGVRWYHAIIAVVAILVAALVGILATFWYYRKHGRLPCSKATAGQSRKTNRSRTESGNSGRFSPVGQGRSDTNTSRPSVTLTNPQPSHPQSNVAFAQGSSPSVTLNTGPSPPSYEEAQGQGHSQRSSANMTSGNPGQGQTLNVQVQGSIQLHLV